MVHAAMRIAAISYIFALPFVIMNMDNDSETPSASVK
jgi:hypothetical protein